ncbi:MAG: hypothetical protein ACREQV_06680, partial [Candidatus Binatia bacterium]
MNANPKRRRLLLIFQAGISLLTGLWAGLARMGWLLPIPNSQFVLVHGPLMVVGFLGALIGLERAVALQRWWAYGIPVLCALSALSALLAAPAQLAALLAALASILMVAVFIALCRQYPSEHFIVMALSALVWFVGNALWFMEEAIFVFVPWWVGFLVLMIAGERLELSRLRQPTPLIRSAFHASVAVILIGLGYSFFDFPTALRLTGIGLFALALWLLRYDLVWQSARQAGLPRFMAICLIAGYVWLAAGGILWIAFAQFFSAGPRYDAMLHAIFLGFVFSMIFAHAPIILPTITGLALPFQNVFYLHVGLLHLALLLRVAGDIRLALPLQQWGGLL